MILGITRRPADRIFFKVVKYQFSYYRPHIDNDYDTLWCITVEEEKGEWKIIDTNDDICWPKQNEKLSKYVRMFYDEFKVYDTMDELLEDNINIFL